MIGPSTTGVIVIVYKLKKKQCKKKIKIEKSVDKTEKFKESVTFKIEEWKEGRNTGVIEPIVKSPF